MYRPTAIVLVSVVLSQGALAQCVASPADRIAAAAPTKVATAAHPATTTPAQQPRQGAELIKTAAAGTRDDGPRVVRETAHAAGGRDDDHPRRGGTAMLLAALALMSGIALRRYGTRNP